MALAGSLVVQLLLVPRAETRRRHDERWEHAVLELSHSLAFDQSASTLRSSLKAIYGAVQSPDGTALSRDEVASRLTTEQIDALKDAYQAFSESLMRYRWLADRVMFRPSVQPRLQDARLYILKHFEHSIRLVGVTQHALGARIDARVQVALPDYAEDAVSFQSILAPGRSYSVNDVNDTYASLAENRLRLVTALEDMANTEPPRRTGIVHTILHRVAIAGRRRREGSETT